ncbi:MAG: hypothetical protein Q4G09_01430 [Clostridia bacterium]|nr:hypothetical protein [Clostridia bacterium]
MVVYEGRCEVCGKYHKLQQDDRKVRYQLDGEPFCTCTRPLSETTCRHQTKCEGYVSLKKVPKK